MPGESTISRRALTLFAVACVAVGIVVSGCGKDKASNAACAPAEKPKLHPISVSKPTEQLDPKKTYIAKFETNCGDFSIKLDVKHNPVTASSFANLVQHGVYDNTWFHRIITDFVIQGGDPSGNGTGGAGYTVREKPTGKYEIGTVAMAKTAADPAGTSSSQFYIVIGAQGTSLPPDYAIAGLVNTGDDTVANIAELAPDPNDSSGTPSGVALIKKATLSVSDGATSSTGAAK